LINNNLLIIGESRYWKTFIPKVEEKFHSSPNCIDFDPSINGNGQFIVTASTKVSLFDGILDKIQRSYSRFQDDAYSGKFRKDGKLIVAGDKNGCVKVFDVQTKNMLRQIKKHDASVRVTNWTLDGLHMLSGSDDRKTIKWDLGTQEIVWINKNGHTDYIRSLASSPILSELFVTGGYDHKINLWDTRQNNSIQTITLLNPIEYCMFSTSGTLIYTASSNEVKVWDLIGGGRLLHTFSNHQKNVTCLCMDGSGSKLMSCGLDGLVKIYNMQSLQVVHGLKIGSPLSSIAVAPDNSKLVLGYVDGTLHIRSRQLKTGELLTKLHESDENNNLDTTFNNKNGRRFFKGAGVAVEKNEDGMVETDRAIKLRPYELQLKKFNYQAALDAALKTRNPLIVITVIEELSRRSGLGIALAGRDENTLEPILSFAARYISKAKFSKLIIQVVQKILDLYGQVLNHSDAIFELFLKLQEQVKIELKFQRQIMNVMGQLDCIINLSTNPINTTTDI